MLDSIYDIETYYNMFSFGLKIPNTDFRYRYEISPRKNDMPHLLTLLNYLKQNNYRMFGFNSLGFDYPVLHFMINNPTVTELDIHYFAMNIINTPWNDRFSNVVYESDHHVTQVDLYKIHHFDNPNRRTSLKALEFNMRMESIQDLPYDPTKPMTSEQMDEVLDYMDHDINATELFYFESEKQIKFREELSEKYDRNFMNDNDVKIGTQFFIMGLEKALPGSCYDNSSGRKKPRQTHRPSIILRDAVLPNIKFKTPEFIRIYEWFKQQTIFETKGVFDGVEATIDDFTYVFGTGGLHGSVDSQTVVSNDEYVIIDLDVASYYPNLAIKNNFYPEHLSVKFCEIYQDVYNQRKTYAKKTAENEMLKLALNGVYGGSNSIYSPFYDPLYTMAITINGQLLLCLLAEMLCEIHGLKMIQANTDGVTVYLKRAYMPFLNSITKAWENITNLELESVEYKRMFIKNVNSYIGEYLDGTLKNKKDYEHAHPRDRRPLGWHKNTSATIVPKAAEAALVRGADIREFIMNHDDIYDFMCRAKVDRSSKLLLGEQEIQRTSRVYVSESGQDLIKIMPTTKPQRIKNPDKLEKRSFFTGFKGWKVRLANDMKDAKKELINYEYYIKETEKIVHPLIR